MNKYFIITALMFATTVSVLTACSPVMTLYWKLLKLPFQSQKSRETMITQEMEMKIQETEMTTKITTMEIMEKKTK